MTVRVMNAESDGQLSLVQAARLAQQDLASFISHLSRLGIPAIRLSAEETEADLDTLEQWLDSRSAMPGGPPKLERGMGLGEP